MTDLELYERVRQKDKEALEILYVRYERILYAFDLQLTKDRDLAKKPCKEYSSNFGVAEAFTMSQKENFVLGSSQ